MEVDDRVVEVAAKAFFKDGKGLPDYPRRTWQEQADEFRNLISSGGVSKNFILTIYNWNLEDYEKRITRWIR